VATRGLSVGQGASEPCDRASLERWSKSRYFTNGSRQHRYTGKGEVYEDLPGSESRASETQIYQAYQGEPERPRHGGYGGTRSKSQGSQTANRQSESLIVPMKHINKYAYDKGTCNEYERCPTRSYAVHANRSGWPHNRSMHGNIGTVHLRYATRWQITVQTVVYR
jgi:hypothetical protein